MEVAANLWAHAQKIVILCSAIFSLQFCCFLTIAQFLWWSAIFAQLWLLLYSADANSVFLLLHKQLSFYYIFLLLKNPDQIKFGL